jgi:hypothetical protein
MTKKQASLGGSSKPVERVAPAQLRDQKARPVIGLCMSMGECIEPIGWHGSSCMGAGPNRISITETVTD